MPLLPVFTRSTRPHGCILVVWGLFLALVLVPAALPARTPSADRAAAADSSAAGTEKADTVQSEEEANPKLVMTLKGGAEITIELYPGEAPKTVVRVLSLVEEGFYDGCKFHRVESYLVQTGRKDSELPPLEGEMFAQNLYHEEGMVGLARLPTDYDSATTQFYICKKRLVRLNGEYTLFGRVVSGMDHVHKIKKGTKIVRIALVE